MSKPRYRVRWYPADRFGQWIVLASIVGEYWWHAGAGETWHEAVENLHAARTRWLQNEIRRRSHVDLVANAW